MSPEFLIEVILGTRPEIIKLAPLLSALKRKRIKFHLVHTQQHYSYKLDKIFFTEFGIAEPNYVLNIGSGTHAEQVGKTLIKLEELLIKENPTFVVVEGDTNSVLASALTAAKLNIKIAHIEAGLRSFDRSMPEEINRILTDRISDLLFAPTYIAKKNLLREGIDKKNVFVTGNTIVDITFKNIKKAKRSSNILTKLNICKDEYFLLTLHRQENVDKKKRLKRIMASVKKICDNYTVIFPVHPRTLKRYKKFEMLKDLKKINNFRIIEPIGYLDFLKLESSARLILTDSGGIQEEACILGVPCVTLRENTERPETVEIGANIIAGTQKESILAAVEKMLKRKRDWKQPFGNGKSGEKIAEILAENRY